VPVVLGQVHYDRYKHWECFLLVCLKDVEEVIVLKEAHSSIGYLEMDASNTFYNSLEQLRYQVLNLVDFAHLKNFLELCQEKCFFYAVSEWPIFQESIE